MNIINKRNSQTKGFTLVEVVVGVAILSIFLIGIYQGYVTVTKVIQSSKFKITASLIANEQIELIRSLAYKDVGVIGSVPNGVIPFSQSFLRNNATYTVETTIRNIDDPFDGQIGSTTYNDLAPADYRLVEFVVKCALCANFNNLTFTTTAAPKNLETTAGNGALFIQVFDANGLAIQGADIVVKNNATSPPIMINDVSNASGLLQLIDIPPGFESYEITVSKLGNSQSQTYSSSTLAGSIPSKPHTTVASGTVTQISFAIDKLSTINFSSQNISCNNVGNISFNLKGSKIIGTNPDIYKYNATSTTNVVGTLTLSNIEWDTYAFTPGDIFYDVAGTVPFIPLSIGPGTVNNVLLIVEANNPDALLVSVKDGGTGLPLSDALVTLSSTSTSYNKTFTTSRGHFVQTDWSGTPGQQNFLDLTRYFNSDGNIETATPVGDLKLKQILGNYAPNAWLESSSFDSGATTTTYYTIEWDPKNQPSETGIDSIKFKVATNNDNTTWNYIGPDGTANTYYTLSNNTLNSSHNNNRYLRYKAFLSTASTSYTPIISDTSVTYGSKCIPFGQVFFNGLAGGTYTLSISKIGYQNFTQNISVTNNWQNYNVTLIP